MPSLRRSLCKADKEQGKGEIKMKADTPVELTGEAQTRADAAHHARDNLWGCETGTSYGSKIN